MIAFEVYLNGEKLCTAGIEELGNLSASLTWQRGPHVLKETLGRKFEYSHFSVSGENVRFRSEKAPHLEHEFKETEHLEWVMQEFPPGSEVTIKAVEVSMVDKPRSRMLTGTQDDSMRAYEKRVREMAEALGWKIQT